MGVNMVSLCVVIQELLSELKKRREGCVETL